LSTTVSTSADGLGRKKVQKIVSTLNMYQGRVIRNRSETAGRPEGGGRPLLLELIEGGRVSIPAKSTRLGEPGSAPFHAKSRIVRIFSKKSAIPFDVKF